MRYKRKIMNCGIKYFILKNNIEHVIKYCYSTFIYDNINLNSLLAYISEN